jgi:hypothetical protein
LTIRKQEKVINYLKNSILFSFDLLFLYGYVPALGTV